jgi:hypothetical protein
MVKHYEKNNSLSTPGRCAHSTRAPTTLVLAEQSIADESSDNDLNVLFEDTLDPSAASVSTESKQYLIVKGRWGQGSDNETDGYFGARIIRRGRVGVFKGVYNKTDDSERHQIVGIMKKGYFNGKIITDEGEYKITGLYRVDKENKLLKLQWMVPGSGGWAVGRIELGSS